MKTILFLIAMSCVGCEFHIHEEPVPCGYEELPLEHIPLSCEAYPWTYNGECCTWEVEEYYSECIERWCYNRFICGWELHDYSCYPI